jgi:RNA polymerase sigma-70 factor, ECF subfamily
MWARVSETDEAEARTTAQTADASGVDEAELRFVLRLRQRDERAFNELVLTFQDRIFRLVWRMVGRREEAEDMTQEVFVQVFKAIDQFRGDSQLSTWIYRIAVNLCKNRTKYHQRRHQSGHMEFDSEIARTQEGSRGVTTGETTRPDQLVQGYQMEHIVQRALHDMDPDFREVLVLRDVECLSYEEIGSITGLAEGTVKSRIHRARTALETAVERALGEKLR